jgi:hypothetical protein
MDGTCTYVGGGVSINIHCVKLKERVLGSCLQTRKVIFIFTDIPLCWWINMYCLQWNVTTVFGVVLSHYVQSAMYSSVTEIQQMQRLY